MRIGLWLLPSAIIRRLLAHMTSGSHSLSNADQASRDRIIWAVVVASRYIPKATCLTKAMVAQVLLEQEGYPACLQIGVAKSDVGKVEAHAWVESQGQVVIGESGLKRYTPLSAFEGKGP